MRFGPYHSHIRKNAALVTILIVACYPFGFLASDTNPPNTLDKAPPNARQSDAPRGSADPILGTIPETEPDLPPDTAVFIRLGNETHRLLEFAQVARERVRQSEKSPPKPNAHLQMMIDPESTNQFMEVIIGSGVGTPHWVVRIDRQLKVTSYKRTISRDRL